ncbi:alternative ribosome rescue aminoacyl-tRNA hydrolase ArfB [Croceicoccus mobilis]|uniref:Aminoacyl-tRNA hydrolase n=1 Tax=Croceicoccus mobilis TaxID=1703339 RepID=A0A916Z1H4_9SPHN|nr:alternative ribosome rescue aminoacyl-tRNA hydrolase ArfB [Croceicoccus mobilis]GGD71392.1 aminoacyl-tRNA hydrolase [Croceicoccus mobilis]
MANSTGGIIDRAHSQAEERFVTASGPGGQNVNKVATAVQLRVNIYALNLPQPIFHRLQRIAGSKLTASGDLLIEAKRFRTQAENRSDARDKLTELLEQAMVKPKKRAKTRVNRVGKVKRLKSKKERGEVKAKRGAVKSWD